jgi:hypothetical protein
METRHSQKEIFNLMFVLPLKEPMKFSGGFSLTEMMGDMVGLY